MVRIHRVRIVLTLKWITDIYSHSLLLIRTNSETAQLQFWTFGISGTSHQSHLDPLQFTSSSFCPHFTIPVWKCVYVLDWPKSWFGFSARCYGPTQTFWPALCILRSQYVRKIIESSCSVWRTLTFKKKNASYSQRKICPVAFLFCQPFSNSFISLLSKEKAWETSISEECLSHLADQGHGPLNTPTPWLSNLCTLLIPFKMELFIGIRKSKNIKSNPELKIKVCLKAWKFLFSLGL